MITVRVSMIKGRLPASAGAGRPAAGDPLRAEPDRLPASRPRLFGAGRLASRARAGGGRFLLRIEDIDQQPLPARVRGRRSYEDLRLARARLGRPGAAPVGASATTTARRSTRLEAAWACSIPASAPGAQIRAEIAACRPGAARAGRASRSIPAPAAASARPSAPSGSRAGEPYALRLDVARGRCARPARSPGATSAPATVAAEPELLGDVVLARKDVPTSYHLAVTVDDALQGVTLVTRGEDLFEATHVHRLLQALLGLPTPRYYHHNLIAEFDRAAARQARPRGDPAHAAPVRPPAGRHLEPDRPARPMPATAAE